MNEIQPEHSPLPEASELQPESSRSSLFSVFLLRKNFEQCKAELDAATDWNDKEAIWQNILELREEAHRLYEELQPRITKVFVKAREVDAVLSSDGGVIQPAYIIPAHELPHAELNPNVNFEDLIFVRHLYEDIDLELQGYSFRQEHGLPSIQEQAATIRESMDRRDFAMANDLLILLKGQFDAHSVYTELVEELWIFLELQERDADPTRTFNPEQSRIAAKVVSGLAELDALSLNEMPLIIDRQQKLLSLIDRLEGFAVEQEWFAGWFMLRSNVLASFDKIHHRMQELELLSQVEGSFDEYHETENAIQATLEELSVLEEKIAETESERDRQGYLAQVEELKQVLQLQYEELEFILLVLGGDSIDTVEIVDDEKIDEYIQRFMDHLSGVEAYKVNLEKNDLRLSQIEEELREKLQSSHGDLRLKLRELLTQKDKSQELHQKLAALERKRDRLRDELIPVYREHASLQRILRALESRRKNQEIYRKYQELNAPEEESDEESVASA